MGTIQRWPASQASRKAVVVVTVSWRAFTSLVERNLASEADFTHFGTKPNCPTKASRTALAGMASSPPAATSTVSTASTACARINTPGRRGQT